MLTNLKKYFARIRKRPSIQPTQTKRQMLWSRLYPAARTFEEAFELHTKNKFNKPLIICGPSGVGKGTLTQSYLKKFPDKMKFSVSSTTRAPRKGELHGREYNFVSEEQFQREIIADNFLEYELVHGNHYGTHIDQVAKAFG